MSKKDFKVGSVCYDDCGCLCILRRITKRIIYYDSVVDDFDKYPRIHKNQAPVDYLQYFEISNEKFPQYLCINHRGEQIQWSNSGFEFSERYLSSRDAEKMAVWILEQLGWEINQ